LASFRGQTGQKQPFLRPLWGRFRGQTGQKGLCGDLFWPDLGGKQPKTADFWPDLEGKQAKNSNFLDLFWPDFEGKQAKNSHF
jgi:hypothetical protein